MWRSKVYTENELIEAIKTSKNINQVIVKIGITSQGSAYDTIKKYIKESNIDVSHFK